MEIQLTQGKVALIDDEDFHAVRDYGWAAIKSGKRWYASSSGLLLMHRVILGLSKDDSEVDHINGDGLDNRKANLRLSNPSLNQANSVKRDNTSSKYKGVSFDKQTGRWIAYIMKDKRSFNLGRYDDEIQAARAYDEIALEFFGEYARLNFPKREES